MVHSTCSVCGNGVILDGPAGLKLSLTLYPRLASNLSFSDLSFLVLETQGQDTAARQISVLLS